MTPYHSDDQHHLIDLSALSSATRNYQLSMPPTTSSSATHRSFYINVCRTLLPLEGARACPPEAAACMRDEARNASVSLGRIEEALEVDDQGRVVMRYTGGDKCGEGDTYRAVVTFECQRVAGAGNPLLTSEPEACAVEVLWRTALACPPDDEADSPDNNDGFCRAVNPVTGSH
ncbi:MAG: hypothetical protein AAFO91_16980 [Bacteroidota bacterium]